MRPPPSPPDHEHGPPDAGALALLGACLAISVPGLILHLAGFDVESHAYTGILLFGSSIVAAAFVLTWAAELAEMEFGSGLAVILLALVTVLPEYAIDLYFAWTAAAVPAHEGFALANMTGANRLLVGMGWPVLALIAWRRTGRRSLDLPRSRSREVVWLAVATLYSLVIPLKGTLAWYDAGVLVGIFGAYVWLSRGGGHEDVELVGPPRALAMMRPRRRRWMILGLFTWSAVAILGAAEPFAESLKHGGYRLGVNEHLLVQWLAPLASEAPEFVVVILLALRGRAAMGFAALVSSKINQWTLLVGGVPLAFGLAHLVQGEAFAPHLTLGAWQKEELWLTATQGLYATAAIVDLRFSLGQALAILILFVVQLAGSIGLEAAGLHDAVGPFHAGLSVLYAILALERVISQRGDLRARLADGFGRSN